jgi:cysteine-rich repeat protein
MLTTGCLLLLFGAWPISAATLRVINLDGPNEGFNDTTPAAPVGGNPGTTRGAQRLKAFQFAADIWGSRLAGSVEIRVGAEFNPLPCGAVSAILGSAGPNSIIRDFINAPVAQTWFVQALANSLLGVDADPGEDDMGAEFNSRIGSSDCLAGSGWYFGLDGNPPPEQIDFVTIVLHELGHGLGFLELLNLKTGAKFLGLDDAFMRFLENPETGKLYPEMLDHERAEASTAGNLQWAGIGVSSGGEWLVHGKDQQTGQVELYAPPQVEFGASVTHFSEEVEPNELMEPFYTGPNHKVELTASLLADIGWNVLEVESCGDGVLAPGEMCDDGARAGGDGCDYRCQMEACFNCEGAPSTCTLDPTCGLTLDHFKCYQSRVAKGAPLFAPRTVTLTDSVSTTDLKIVKPTNLCTPVKVDDGGVFDPTAHLTCYQLKSAPGQQQEATQQVRVANQFGGDQRVTVLQLQSLCAPSTVDHAPSSLALAPYACYAARASQESHPLKPHEIDLTDRFASVTMTIGQPVNFCAPLIANQPDAIDSDASFTCYQLQKKPGVDNSGSHKVIVANLLGSSQALEVLTPDVLCVPSHKLAP